MEIPSVGLGEDDSSSAGSATADAFACFLKGIEGDASNGDGQILFDSIFTFGLAAPVAESESAMNFRFVGILRRKKRIEFRWVIDWPGVGLLKCQRTVEQPLLDFIENRGDRFQENGFG
jgi:hypothetical protein